MPDYTPLGYQKIAQQAANDLTSIRCPRDGVVMRVLLCRAERRERAGLMLREFPRLPKGGDWRIMELDVECPACRRRAGGIRLSTGTAEGARRPTPSETAPAAP